MPEEKTSTTAYQVLELKTLNEALTDTADAEPVETWVTVGDPVTVPAGQSRQAIKAATQDRDEDGKRGTFVAVPARSWNPETRGQKLQDTWS